MNLELEGSTRESLQASLAPNSFNSVAQACVMEDMRKILCNILNIIVVDLLQAESRVAIVWFTLNQMVANPEKFQAIFINCVENDIEIKGTPWDETFSMLSILKI